MKFYLKVLIALVLSVAMMVPLSACGSQSTAATESKKPAPSSKAEESPASKEETGKEGTSSAAVPGKTYNVLFVGNSFTYYNEMPNLFYKMATSAGLGMSVRSVTVGSAHLSWFTNPKNAISEEFSKAVEAGGYDFAFLQAASGDATFSEDVANLTSIIRSKSPNCTVYLYETWGFKEGHGKLKELKTDTKGHAVIYVDSYLKAAQENSLPVSFAGISHYKVYTETEYDPYHTDLKHPSYYGSCVAALTHLYTLFPEVERTAVTFRSEQLDDKCFDALSKIAYGVAHDPNAAENFKNG